jgi:hypothetical protein
VHSQDILKVSGQQVSPVEIENVLLANPKKLITDVSVAGVSGGRTSDEKVPRAWIVLSDVGKRMGAEAVKQELEVWHRENLSKYKWLRGGIEVVKQVRWLKCVGVRLREADGCWLVGCRYRSRRLVRCCDGRCEMIMRSRLKAGRGCSGIS